MTPRIGAIEQLRRQVLRLLAERGTSSVHDIPRAWPVLRIHVEAVVRQLAREGLIETASDGTGRGGLRLTAAGRRALDLASTSRNRPAAGAPR